MTDKSRTISDNVSISQSKCLFCPATRIVEVHNDSGWVKSACPTCGKYLFTNQHTEEDAIRDFKLDNVEVLRKISRAIIDKQTAEGWHEVIIHKEFIAPLAK